MCIPNIYSTQYIAHQYTRCIVAHCLSVVKAMQKSRCLLNVVLPLSYVLLHVTLKILDRTRLCGYGKYIRSLTRTQTSIPLDMWEREIMFLSNVGSFSFCCCCYCRCRSSCMWFLYCTEVLCHSKESIVLCIYTYKTHIGIASYLVVLAIYKWTHVAFCNIEKKKRRRKHHSFCFQSKLAVQTRFDCMYRTNDR